MKKRFSSIAAVFLLLSLTSHAQAEGGSVFDELSSLYARKEPLGLALVSGFQSRHLTSRNQFNDSNHGIGMRLEDGWVVGGYYNSIRRYSVYAGREYQWNLGGSDWFKLNAGLVLAAVSGYEEGLRRSRGKHGIIPVLLPELVLVVPHAELAVFYVPSMSRTPATITAQFRISF